jgi:hypothetical protein
MQLEPVDWSVVVIGRWNRAILTPAGIGQRLFRVEEGTPLEVLIAIDALGPPIVKHNGLTVVAGSDRLIVQPDALNRDGVAKSCEIARNAISSLPETPLSAVGINLKYRCEDYFDPIDNAFTTEIDTRATERGLNRIESQLQQSYNFESGRVNVIIAIGEDGKRSLAFNFEWQTNRKDDHLNWLATSFDTLTSLMTKVTEQILQIPKSEIKYELS